MRVLKLRAYLKAAHFGPTMIVTGISFFLASKLWWEGPAYVIAVTVFLGQLLIGWSNDLYDYEDDLIHARTNKPLVAGVLTSSELRRTTFLLLPLAVIANVIGPLGIKGGLVYLLGVGCGIAYNFYFKFTWLSFLPYALACAALPASIFFAIGRTPPLYVGIVGALVGVAFHFLNVIKDFDQDRESEIGGLPQRLGKSLSVATVLILLTCAGIIFSNNPVSQDFTSISDSKQNDASVFSVGGDRPALVRLPSGYSKEVPAPLLVDMHGYMSNSGTHQRFAMMDLAAKQLGFIYIAPDGTADTQGYQFWNATKACCNLYGSTVDDVSYLQSLVNEISKKVSVDAKRIYFFGHSNGAFMAYKFACAHPEVVAAVSGLAGAMDEQSDLCAAKSPVSVLQIHGTKDEVINYFGGSIIGNSYTSATEGAQRWAATDGCALKPSVAPAIDLLASLDGAETVKTIYSCKDNDVELWSINNGSHSPLLDFNFSTSILKWFLDHPKK